MRTLLTLCIVIILNNLRLFSQNDSVQSEAIIGQWVLYKDSSSVGKVSMAIDEIDTLRFLPNGKYSRIYTSTTPDDAIAMDNGSWAYSDNKKEINLSQITREYIYISQLNPHKLTDYSINIERINENEFYERFIADANANNEVIIYYRYYKKIN